ncbi:hypothetical protein [Fusobacterium ulcerans]|uniref:hypothetical protein n=1 Tax=Fusobacterium ulcerans TaxID=861 RepID=UPI0030ABF1EC
MYKKSISIVVTLIIFYIFGGIGLLGLIYLASMFALKLFHNVDLIFFLVGGLIFILYLYYKFKKLFNSIEINGDILIVKTLFRKKNQFFIKENIFSPSIKTYSINSVPFAEVLILKIINKENKKTFRFFFAGYTQESNLEILEKVYASEIRILNQHII